ncbi:unnamed protein product [Trifolium pratense]|uniref:Uncharacterized protein n=1 Tax=Trifolium pratense TaxID=57577 RepID=A0ACB0KYY9_TRIPR|nr:unnamed protein product [Trifolium pratense]
MFPQIFYPWKIIGENQSSIVLYQPIVLLVLSILRLHYTWIFFVKENLVHMVVLVSLILVIYWGMNIEKGKKYKVVLYVRSLGPINLQVSFIGSADGVNLGSKNIRAHGLNVTKWSRVERTIKARGTNHNSSLQITTKTRGVLWLDQVSAMPLDTYNDHDFGSDLFKMVADLKPKFLSDDGLGYFEGLQLSEDLGALPVWVFNNGINHHDEVNTSSISLFVQEALDGIEFARGSTTSRWGSLRASMGHPKPFNLRFVAIGNEDCGKLYYEENYMKFYEATRHTYPDIQIISNCDSSVHPLNHPADIYDYHIYTNSKDMFSKYTKFDKSPRSGPKAFVSEYAVWKEDAGAGSLYATVAEAAFLIGIAKNSDVVNMVAYAPLLSNINDNGWKPYAIVFNSYQNYGTPSYWLQQLFIESSGATLLNSTLQNSSTSIVASVIQYKNSQDGNNYVRVKVVNFGKVTENLEILINGLNTNVQPCGSSMLVLTSNKIMDENSFSKPTKIIPQRTSLGNASKDMNVKLPPYSVT